MSTTPFPIQAMEVINLVSNIKSQGLLSKEDLAAIVRDIMASLPPHMRTKPHSGTREILDAFLQKVIDEAPVREPRKDPVPEATKEIGGGDGGVLASPRPADGPKENSFRKAKGRKTKRSSVRVPAKGSSEAS